MSPSIPESKPAQSLRSFLTFLDERNELIHIARSVNPRFELAAVIQDIQKSGGYLAEADEWAEEEEWIEEEVE